MNSETDTFKKNMHRFYGSNTPIGNQVFGNSGVVQSKIQEKFQQKQQLQEQEQYQQRQFQQSLKSLNKSIEEAPYYLDPISHQRVYRTNMIVNRK